MGSVDGSSSERSVWVWWFRAPRAFSLAAAHAQRSQHRRFVIPETGLVACSRSFAPLRHPVPAQCGLDGAWPTWGILDAKDDLGQGR